jgi:hypothetical protein
MRDTPKILKRGVLIGGVVMLVLAAFLIRTGHHSSGGWSLRSCPKPPWGWHLETGYLFDSPGMFDLHTDPYISGTWYRFGPVAIQHRWRSCVTATNLPAQSRTTRVF